MTKIKWEKLSDGSLSLADGTEPAQWRITENEDAWQELRQSGRLRGTFMYKEGAKRLQRHIQEGIDQAHTEALAIEMDRAERRAQLAGWFKRQRQLHPFITRVREFREASRGAPGGQAIGLREAQQAIIDQDHTEALAIEDERRALRQWSVFEGRVTVAMGANLFRPTRYARTYRQGKVIVIDEDHAEALKIEAIRGWAGRAEQARGASAAVDRVARLATLDRLMTGAVEAISRQAAFLAEMSAERAELMTSETRLTATEKAQNAVPLGTDTLDDQGPQIGSERLCDLAGCPIPEHYSVR